MLVPAEILDAVASLQNDTAKTVYTNAACLPYLNMAMRDLQEQFQLNDIPVTHESSHVITVPAGVTSVGFSTNPNLPADLTEIQALWESYTDQNNWVPMEKKNYLPHYLSETQVSSFIVWAWVNNEIKLPLANQANDIKIDYIKSLFTTITNVNIPLDSKFTNLFSYLQYRTAAFCSMYIGENETRALALQNDAIGALQTSLGISIKGQQSIAIRRLPFRLSYKQRKGWWG